MKQNAKNKLSLRTKLAYGSVALGFELCATTWHLFALHFMTNIAHLSPTLTGFVAVVYRVWDALNDPFIGRAQDNSVNKFSRRHWMGISTIPYALCFALMWFVPTDDPFFLTLYFLTIKCGSDLFFTAINVGYIALLNDITTDYNDRFTCNIFRFLGSGLGSLGAALLSLFYGALLSDDKSTFRAVGITCATLMTICVMWCFVETSSIPGAQPHAKSRVFEQEQQEQRQSFYSRQDNDIDIEDSEHHRIPTLTRRGGYHQIHSHNDIDDNIHHHHERQSSTLLGTSSPSSSIWSAIRREWHLIQRLLNVTEYRKVLIVYVCTLCALQTTLSVIPYLLQDYLGLSQTQLVLVVLTGQVSGILTAVLLLLGKQFVEKRTVYTWGASVWLALYLAVPAAHPSIAFLVYPAALLLGVGLSTALVIPLSMVNDCAEFVEHDTGRRMEGTMFGMIHGAQKVVLGAILFLFEALLEATGFQGSNEERDMSPTAALGIRLLLAVIPGSLLMVALYTNRRIQMSKPSIAAVKRKIRLRSDPTKRREYEQQQYQYYRYRYNQMNNNNNNNNNIENNNNYEFIVGNIDQEDFNHNSNIPINDDDNDNDDDNEAHHLDVDIDIMHHRRRHRSPPLKPRPSVGHPVGINPEYIHTHNHSSSSSSSHHHHQHHHQHHRRPDVCLTIFLFDGVKNSVFRDLLAQGRLPNIARMMEQGTQVREAVTAFPSMTGYAFYPVITGRDAAGSGVLGLRWFDRTRTEAPFRNYVGRTNWLMSHDTRPSPPTLYEDFAEDHSLSVQTYMNRGVKEAAMHGWPFTTAKFGDSFWGLRLLRQLPGIGRQVTYDWWEAECAVVDTAIRDLGQHRPRVQWVTLSSIDSAHHLEADSEQYVQLIEDGDRQLGRYMKAAQRLGEDERRLYVMMTDHGMTAVTHNLDVGAFLERDLGLRTDQGNSTNLATEHLEKGMEQYEETDAVVCINGNCLVYIYLRHPDYSWDIPQPLPHHLLTRYPSVIPGTEVSVHINLIEELAAHEAVELVLYRGPHPDRLTSVQERNENENELESEEKYLNNNHDNNNNLSNDLCCAYIQDGEGRIGVIEGRKNHPKQREYRYTVLTEERGDPLHFPPSVHERLAGFHGWREWLTETYHPEDHRFPYAVPRIWELMMTPDATVGDVVLTSAPGWDFAKDFELFVGEYRGGHGGLRWDQMNVPYVVRGPGVMAGQTLETCRVEDLGATLKHLMGVDPAHEDTTGSVLWDMVVPDDDNGDDNDNGANPETSSSATNFTNPLK